MSEYSAKNYTEQGGEITHIGGTLIIEEGATVEGLPSGDEYVLPIASASELGGIKVGEGLSIDEEGILSADGGEEYTLPVAGESTLGGVKIGEGLSIDEEGVLSADGGDEYELPAATRNSLGGVKIGQGLGITNAGVLSVDNLAVGVHPQAITVTGTTADDNINISFPGGTARSTLLRPFNSPQETAYYVKYGPSMIACLMTGYSPDDKRVYFRGYNDIGGSSPEEIIIGISYDTSDTPSDVVIINSL